MRPVLNVHLLPAEQALEEAQSSLAGLSEKEAAIRLADGGPNSLPLAAPPSWLRRWLGQMADPMVMVLLLAAAVSALFGQAADSLVIAMVVVLNGALGVYQEGKAQRAVEALSRLAAPQAVVRRDGTWRELPGAELVVGDVVRLEAGDSCPADLRLLDSWELRVDQSSLTGESLPIPKQAGAMSADAVPAERDNMVYLGSPILAGRGLGLVSACGSDTATGRIAGLLASTQLSATPLQKKLAQLSRQLSLAVLAICLLVFIAGLLNGGDRSATGLLSLLMLSISLAVAAIPEGLVVVVTMVLSLGMRAISRERGLVRRLNAVETLGATEIICSDKTGTLTENRMQVVSTWQLTDRGLLAAALCQSLPEGEGALGDPTELALVAYAAQQGQPRADLAARWPLRAELPFDSQRKRMSTLHQDPAGGYLQLSKGAPELLLTCCDRLELDGRVQPLTAERRQEILAQQKSLAEQALRVLALAYTPRGQARIEESGLIFAGLAGLMDRPRPGVKEALAAAAAAGIRTVMVSGDGADTAAAIGRELGLIGPGQRVVEGRELAAMDERTLRRELPRIAVFARVRPEEKLRIVRAWQSLGKVTAMTGDGVNDAPALKAADIGVGMGICGSEVSRQVAALVLADDDYATIVRAVREGRRIYENIRKALQFLLASNLAEVLVIFLASLLGLEILLPIHLLWINLITDCFPAIALGVEELEPDAMTKPPRPAREGLFSQGMGRDVLWQGAVLAVLTLLAYGQGRASGPQAAMTMAFITLSCGEVFHAWNLRSRLRSLFSLPSANRLLGLSLLCSLALSLALLYIPALSGLFRVAALSAGQLLTSLALAAAIVPVVELMKAIRRRLMKK